MSEEALYEVLFDIATSLRKLAEHTERITNVLENPITIRVKDPDEDYVEYEEEEQPRQEPIVVDDEDLSEPQEEH